MTLPLRSLSVSGFACLANRPMHRVFRKHGADGDQPGGTSGLVVFQRKEESAGGDFSCLIRWLTEDGPTALDHADCTKITSTNRFCEMSIQLTKPV